MNSKNGNLAVLSHIRTEKKIELLDHPLHEMTLALQTTLQVDELLDLFSIHLQPAVAHDSYVFFGKIVDLEWRAGKGGRHTCAYTLTLENDVLGEIRLARAKRYSETELATIEAYLCRILYPLRNALLYRQALQSAYVDPLTNTRNRTALLGTFRREWKLASRHGSPLSVIMLDIDHFKSVNDNHGHDAGDAVLKAIAGAIKDSVRDSDIVFRYGGEEFVILLSNTAEDGAALLAERIRSSLESTLVRVGTQPPLRLTASMGVATLTAGEGQDDLLKRADQAMYKAKSMGRNRVAVS
ncbi:GGDEF domain-containing protein [Methylococcus sp. EFPC2]|uniref:GGDEF domain-containing protein n=1 Tax=Methylococcus sp. EFPC2 TaxID=2812648 RepID=UPI0019674BE4|nr:GGDEF domain-containing protein [Methylococcus sp. EFPC2]QSA98218.1 GGDEF domain-containing protein [Methylococcus sp. EFPC2]